jgi:hypothetical protein
MAPWQRGMGGGVHGASGALLANHPAKVEIERRGEGDAGDGRENNIGHGGAQCGFGKLHTDSHGARRHIRGGFSCCLEEGLAHSSGERHLEAAGSRRFDGAPHLGGGQGVTVAEGYSQ